MTEDLQTVLLVITTAGVGGVWFRLGQALSGLDAVRGRMDRLETRVSHLERADG